MSRRRVNAILSVMVILSILIVSACSKKENSSEPDTKQTAGQTSDAEASAKEIDPMGKYDPPIEVTSVRAVDSTFKYLDNDSLDNNVWTRAYEEKLGIKVKNLWAVDSAQYAEKLNISIASKSIPDVMMVGLKEFQSLVENNMLEDLSEAYDKYATPFTKEVLTKDGGIAMDLAKYQGKLYAIPFLSTAIANSKILYVRTDWLKKLNLPEPKTMQDVLKVSEAFTTQDPDGNGKKDTFGLALAQGYVDGAFGDLLGFFNGYHAYPNKWIKGSDGQLVNGSIQPEMKNALQELQNMYKKGQIDPEFAVKPWNKEAELAISGKLGLFYGVVWNPFNPLVDSIKQNPGSEWKALPIVSVDNNPARPIASDPVIGFYVVKKGYEHPEAIVKMGNYYLEKGYGTDPDPKLFNAPNTDGTSLAVAMYALVRIIPHDIHLIWYHNILEALKTNDASKLNGDEKTLHDEIKKYPEDINSWAYLREYGEGGSMSVIDYYNSHDLILFNEFNGSTPTMISKSSILSELQTEVFTKIIMGAAPIDEFDKFVDQWKKLGGDEMTKEVNDWYSSKK
ncbi:extracellular solute-binding protein [Cohnella soli]|uniref:Extracellular solute-binding protein n=1 Tax=Cohnella soli TaxID=425005 RepID=A0ABW0HZR8_9BACL